MAGIDHYLDNFIIVAPPASDRCLAQMKEECDELGVTLATEKTAGPTTCLTFPVIQIDTVAQQLSLLQDKLEHLQSDVESLLTSKSCQRRKLESLVGSLQFAARVILPCRPIIYEEDDRVAERPSSPDDRVRFGCLRELGCRSMVPGEMVAVHVARSGLCFQTVINPRRACAAKVTVVGFVCLSVCLSVTLHLTSRVFVRLTKDTTY